MRQTVPEWRYEPTWHRLWPFNIDAAAFCRHAVSLQQQHRTPRIAGLFLRAGRQCSCCWCRILLGQESINHESTDVPSNCYCRMYTNETKVEPGSLLISISMAWGLTSACFGSPPPPLVEELCASCPEDHARKAICSIQTRPVRTDLYKS